MFASDCSRCPLAADSVFSEAPPVLAEELRRTKTVHDFRPGEVLFHEGLPADNVFCLFSGMAKEYRATGDGRQYVLGLAGPGDLPGAGSVLEGGSYGCSLQAVRPTRACVIPGRILRAILDAADPPARRLLVRFVRSLHRSENARTSLALAPVPERVARLLVDLSRPESGSPDPGTIDLPVKRGDMAEMVGTTPETLSRILHTFRSRGYLDLEGRTICIRDRQGLEREAGGSQL